MERPNKIPKDILPYIEFLEKENADFKTDTKKKFFRGVQRQLDFLADEMLDPTFVVSMKKDVENNGFDSFFDLMAKGDAIVKSMEKFEAQAIPKADDITKKVVKEEGVEEFLNLSHGKG